MKFVLVTQDLNIGGAQRAIIELANNLVKSNHEVCLVTLISQNEEYFKIDERVQLKILSQKESNNTLFKNIKRIIKLRRIVNSFRPDKVISFLEHINILTILSTLGSLSEVNVCIRNDPRRKKMSIIHGYLRRLTYPFANKVIVQTNSVAQWASSLGLNEKIQVIPNFVRKLELKKESYEVSSVFKIVMIGRLVEQKGIDLLFKALALIPKGSINYSLSIYGEGELLEELQGRSEKLGLSENVDFKGTTNEANRVLAEADLFVLSSRYEGYPNVLVEALSTGTPSVAFDCPSGPRDITLNGELGLLIEDGNISKLANGIVEMYESEKLRTDLGKRSVNYFSNIDNVSILNKWLEN